MGQSFWLHDLRHKKIYAAAHKIYGLLQAPHGSIPILIVYIYIYVLW